MAGLVGRRAELDRADAFLSRPGGMRALALEGEAGIGKSTVLRAVVDAAARRGALTLEVAASPAEASLSFAALTELLSPVPDELLAGLAPAQRRALEVALLRAEPTSVAPDRRATGTGLARLLQVLAVEHEVLVAIDDANWLDHPSAAALEFACRRLRSAGVQLAITFRSRDRPPPLLGAVGAPDVLRMGLGPMSLGELGVVLRERLGAMLPRSTLLRVHQACAGNPFFALEIARRVLESGFSPPHDSLPLPVELDALFAERIAALPQATREALLEAAILRAPTLTQIDADALAPAEDAGLVRLSSAGRVEFAHPLVAEAVRSTGAPSTLRHLHRKAAAEVADREERARHLALATMAPDEAVAVELMQAAGAARRLGAPGGAAELAEEALRLTPPDAFDALAARRLAAARYQVDSGDFPRAQRLLAELLASRPGSSHAPALRLQAQVAGRVEHFAEARRIALLALDAAPDEATRSGVRLDLAYYEVSLGDFGAALAQARAALDSLEPSASPEVIGPALAVATMVGFLAGSGVDREQLSRALEHDAAAIDAPNVTRPSLLGALLQVFSGELEAAQEALSEQCARLVDSGQESDLAMCSLYLAWTLVWRGDVVSACAVAAAAREAALLAGDRAGLAISLTTDAFVHAYDGNASLAVDEARRSIAQLEAIGWYSAVIWARWAIALAALGEGDAEVVHAEVGALSEVVLGMGFADPIGCVFVPEEIDALVALGEHARAESLVEMLEVRGAQLDRAWALAAAARGRGELAAAAGDLEGSLELFERALAEHDRAGMPLERARTLLGLGRALRRLKRRGEARRVFAEALSIFDAAGARTWASQARHELSRTGTPRAELDDRGAGSIALSATERQVAELAAADLSNREIAARAFLSVKAVEANLSRAYRKLGVRSRAGLAEALRAEADALRADPRATERSDQTDVQRGDHAGGRTSMPSPTASR